MTHLQAASKEPQFFALWSSAQSFLSGLPSWLWGFLRGRTVKENKGEVTVLFMMSWNHILSFLPHAMLSVGQSTLEGRELDSTFFFSCRAGDGTQSLTHARQVVPLTCITSPWCSTSYSLKRFNYHTTWMGHWRISNISGQEFIIQ